MSRINIRYQSVPESSVATVYEANIQNFVPRAGDYVQLPVAKEDEQFIDANEHGQHILDFSVLSVVWVNDAIVRQGDLGVDQNGYTLNSSTPSVIINVRS